MKIVKVTTSGQITIPTQMRKQIKTQIFSCEMTTEGILFRPIEVPTSKTKKYKYTMEDFRKWSFKSKNPKEKNLAGKIDEIVYTI